MARQIEVTNEMTANIDEIITMIKNKGDIVVRGRDLNKQIEGLKEELNTCGLDINKINDKLIPLVKEIPIELGEWEQIQSVEIVDGKLMMTIYDQIEEYKEVLKKNAEPKEENNVK